MLLQWAPERTRIKRSSENSDILGPRNAFLGFMGAPERRSGAFRLTFTTAVKFTPNAGQ